MSLLADLPAMAVDVAHHGDRPLVLLARGQVLRREPDGRMTSVAGRLDGARSMVSAPGGGAYVVEAGSGSGAGRVIRIDGEGGTDGEVARGLTDPRAVAVGRDGTVWVTHPGGATGFRDGAAVARLDGIAEPHGIAVGAAHAVIADPGRRAVVAVEVASGRATDVVTVRPARAAGRGRRHAARLLARRRRRRLLPGRVRRRRQHPPPVPGIAGRGRVA